MINNTQLINGQYEKSKKKLFSPFFSPKPTFKSQSVEDVLESCFKYPENPVETGRIFQAGLCNRHWEYLLGDDHNCVKVAKYLLASQNNLLKKHLEAGYSHKTFRGDYQTHERIAKATGLSEWIVRMARKKLTELGIISHIPAYKFGYSAQEGLYPNKTLFICFMFGTIEIKLRNILHPVNDNSARTNSKSQTVSKEVYYSNNISKKEFKPKPVETFYNRFLRLNPVDPPKKVYQEVKKDDKTEISILNEQDRESINDQFAELLKELRRA